MWHLGRAGTPRYLFDILRTPSPGVKEIPQKAPTIETAGWEEIDDDGAFPYPIGVMCLGKLCQERLRQSDV